MSKWMSVGGFVVAVVALAVLAVVPGGLGPSVAPAFAGAHWDAASGSYVTGDADTLTFWKVREGKVVEATRYAVHLKGVPVYESAVEEGEEVRRQVGVRTEGHFWSLTLRPGDPVALAPMPAWFAPPAAGDYEPLPGGAACGADGKACK